MATKRTSSRSSTGRSTSAVSPAQRRRQQAAAAAGRASGGPVSGSGAGGRGDAARRSPATLPDTRRWTRDRILGWGAGLGALLALASLTAPALALFFGLLYAAVALLRPSDRQRTQLTVSTAAIALWVLLSTVVVVILVATTANGSDEEQTGDISLTGGYLALSLASGVLITLAVALVAAGFYTTSGRRYRLFSWSGLCLVAYYILFLPSAVSESSAPSALGSFWPDAIGFARVLFGIIAGLIMAVTFRRYGNLHRDDEAARVERGIGSGDRESGEESDEGVRFTFREREYLLATAAVLLLLSRLSDFVFVDWASLRPADDQTTSEAAFQALIFLAILLRLPVLFGSATVAFWTSARQAGWRSTSLLAAPATNTKIGTGINTIDETTPGEHTRHSPSLRLLLSWRLPLVLVWLVLLVAAMSFLGWYGCLAAAPAAAHYLWMLTRKIPDTADVE